MLGEIQGPDGVFGGARMPDGDPGASAALHLNIGKGDPQRFEEPIFFVPSNVGHRHFFLQKVKLL